MPTVPLECTLTLGVQVCTDLLGHKIDNTFSGLNKNKENKENKKAKQWKLKSPSPLREGPEYTNPANPVGNFWLEKLAAPPCMKKNQELRDGPLYHPGGKEGGFIPNTTRVAKTLIYVAHIYFTKLTISVFLSFVSFAYL